MTIGNHPPGVLLRPYYCSLSSLELSSLVRSMTSCSPLEVMSLSFLSSPTSVFVGGHVHGFPCQMWNLLGKSCVFEPAFALVLGDDCTFELTVSVVKLGFIVDNPLIEISIPHNISFKPPVIHILDCIKEDSIARGWPLKGFVDPMG